MLDASPEEGGGGGGGGGVGEPGGGRDGSQRSSESRSSEENDNKPESSAGDFYNLPIKGNNRDPPPTKLTKKVMICINATLFLQS